MNNRQKGNEPIHKYPELHKARISRLDKESRSRVTISSSNREIIKKYDMEAGLRNIAIPTRIKYVDVLTKVLEYNPDIEFSELQEDTEPTKESWKKVITTLNERDLSIHSKQKYRAVIKKFGNWLIHKDKVFSGEEKVYCSATGWINTNIKKNMKPKLRPSDILSEKEVFTLINAAPDLMGKAFLWLLYETGGRISEIATLRVGDIQRSNIGMKIHVHGKTGARTPMVSMSVPLLTAWLNNHPSNNDSSSYLWLYPKNDGSYRLRSYAAWRKYLERVVQRSGIKKRVYFHLFRHVRVTHLLANGVMNEAQAKKYFGWQDESKVLGETYSHLCIDDANKAYAVSLGLVPKENSDGSIQCRNCSFSNPPSTTFCVTCHVMLDVHKGNEELERSNDMLLQIMKDERFITILNEYITKR